MVEASDNPPSSEFKAHHMNHFSLTDVRSRFKTPYASRDGYPGYALGVSIMRIPVSLFLDEDGKPLPLDKSTLSKTIKAVKGLYDVQKGSPAQISYMAQGVEIFAPVLKGAYAANQ